MIDEMSDFLEWTYEEQSRCVTMAACIRVMGYSAFPEPFFRRARELTHWLHEDGIDPLDWTDLVEQGLRGGN